MFLAMDEDDSGVLQCNMVEEFVRSFLRGHQVPNKADTSFEDCHTSVYAILQEEESQEVTPDMMACRIASSSRNKIAHLIYDSRKRPTRRPVEPQRSSSDY